MAMKAVIVYVHPLTDEVIEYKVDHVPLNKHKVTPKDADDITRIFCTVMTLNYGREFLNSILKEEVYVELDGRLLCYWIPELEAWQDIVSKKGWPLNVTCKLAKDFYGNDFLCHEYSYVDDNHDEEACEDLAFRGYEYSQL